MSGALPSQDLLALTYDNELIRSLSSTRYGLPLALGTVIKEGIAKKQYIPLRQFLETKESIYHNPWSLNPLHLLGWGLRQLGLFGPGNMSPSSQSRFIVLANLEEAAKVFAGRTAGRRGRTERVWSRHAFAEEFSNLLAGVGGSTSTRLSSADFEILLRFLDRDKGVLVYNGTTVKLRAGESEKEVTQEDETIARLKSLISEMEVQTAVLEKRVEDLAIQAKGAVEKKNRVSALAALRSKKAAETTLGKRHATLAQLEEVFTKIQQANDQVELIDVMEISTSVLKGLNQKIGGVDRVDDVLEGLREQMGQVNEVGDIIAEAGNEGVDENEVDEELVEMERVEREKKEKQERKIREEKEEKEAEETRKRLQALDEDERQAREKEAIERMAQMQREATERAHREAAATNKDLEDSMESMKRISLEPPVEEAT